MTLPKMLVVAALALLFAAGVFSEDLVAPRLEDLELIDVHNDISPNARHGGLKHTNGQTAQRACSSSSQYPFPLPSGPCSTIISVENIAPKAHTTSDNVMTFTYSDQTIGSGNSKTLTLGGYRGVDMTLTYTNPDPNVRIRVLERQHPSIGSGRYVHRDPTQPSAATADVEYWYLYTAPLTYFSINSGGYGEFTIEVANLGGASTLLDLSTLTITLSCAGSTADEHTPFDVVSLNCVANCVHYKRLYGYHFIPDASSATNTGVCIWYSYSSTLTRITPNQNGPNPGEYPFTGQGANPATINIPAYSTRQVYFGPFQAEMFTLAASQPAGANFGFLICQFGASYGTFHGQEELIPPFPATTFSSDVVRTTTPVSGTWLILVGNWGPAATFDPSILTGSFKCKNHQFFEGPFQHAVGLFANQNYMKCPSAPPLEEDDCSYNVLGFNPWERWNIFASANSEYASPIVQGRVASGGELKITNAAKIHTAKGTYNLPKSAKWSVQAGSVVIEGDGANAIVHNGGVESGAATTIAADKVEGEIKQGEALSVDFGLAKKYFAKQSLEWSDRANSVVDGSLAPDESNLLTLTLRLHGKLNFYKITAEEYSDLRVILLTGHPVGTVVISVSGDTQIPVRDFPLRVFYKTTAGGLEQPTFGRVLLNFYEQTTNQFDLGFLQGVEEAEGDPATFVSILAPFASVKYSAQELRGNLIAYNIIVKQGTIKPMPFGTFPQALKTNQPRAPKVWTANGKRAISCLWREL